VIKQKSLIQSLALNAVVAVTARRFVLSPALSCFCHGKVYTHMFMCTVYVCYVCMYVHTHTHTHTHTIDHTLSTRLHRIGLAVDVWEPNYRIHMGALFSILF